jgi:hypothetical protein
VDVILKSEWNDNDTQNFQMSKINIHIHFIQFDNQASDGVITGFSYDQSVRPFTMIGKKGHKGLPPPMNALLTEDAKSGSTSIKIKMGEGATPFHEGTDLMIGMKEVKTSEIRWIKEIKGDTVTFTEPLKFDHKKDEIASVEWVRYRYWVDADTGTVFWHDHAFGATTWPHGGVGAMIVEPAGSTYHDPKTGKPIRSGPIADIHSTEPIGYGERELQGAGGDAARHGPDDRAGGHRGESPRPGDEGRDRCRTDPFVPDALRSGQGCDPDAQRRDPHHGRRVQLPGGIGGAASEAQPESDAGLFQQDPSGPEHAASSGLPGRHDRVSAPA